MKGYVTTLMLTLQRREEVASMQWTELAVDLASWTVPAERAKNHRATVVHLSEQVRTTIASMPKIEDNPFVFAGERKGQPLKGFNSCKAQIDDALSKSGVKLEPWCFHDFRRSGVTALAGLGHPPHICDRILNHITGSIQGVAAIYQRHEFLMERKAALDAWAALVLRAAVGSTRPRETNSNSAKAWECVNQQQATPIQNGESEPSCRQTFTKR